MASRSTAIRVYCSQPSFCFNLKIEIITNFGFFFLVVFVFFFLKLLKMFLVVKLLTLENQILHQIQYFFHGDFDECTHC